MPSLFISYRREDAIAYAGRLYDHLSSHFGADNVFMDIGQIAPGEDFVEVLDARIRSSDVVIALIGPAWLSVSNEQGRRLEQADDFVRYELAAALAQGKRLIPVLVGGARMPNVNELPAAIGAWPAARHTRLTTRVSSTTSTHSFDRSSGGLRCCGSSCSSPVPSGCADGGRESRRASLC